MYKGPQSPAAPKSLSKAAEMMTTEQRVRRIAGFEQAATGN